MPKKRSQTKKRSSSTSRRKRRSDQELLAELESRIAALKAKIEASQSFSPDAVREDRERLQLSASDYAELVGVSMLTIYNWEKGRSQPRTKQLGQWLDVCGMSPKAAWKHLGYND